MTGDMPILHLTDSFGRPIELRVGMWVFAPWEQQAHANHGQSLTQLQQRGGLDASEAVAILTGQPWRDMPPREAHAMLVRLVNAAVSHRGDGG